MSNKIVQEQNKQNQIERLAAQSYLYSTGKRAVVAQTLLDVLSPIVFAGLAAIFPDLLYFTAVGTCIVTVLDQVLERYQSSHKKQAATIQETFDCDVLELECRDLAKNHVPDLEDVLEAADGYKKLHGNYSKLENWYPEIVEQLPLYLARLICQRENCWWDAQLRRRFVRWVGYILAFLCLIVASIGFIGGFTLPKLIFIIVIPLIPAFVWAIREYHGQSEAANDRDELKKYSEDLWEKALKKEHSAKDIDEKSRHLQDQIYNSRRNNPFILDLFYSHLRSKNEIQMNRKAEELVKEAKLSLLQNNP